jgi:LmbE family N-acetylglucosaminyl deacetylase
MAYQWAGRENRYSDQLLDGVAVHRVRKLYYGTANFVLAGRPPVSPAPITTVIEIGEHVKTKIAAFEAHATQAPVFPLVRDTILSRGPEEYFHLAATTEPRSATPETDLFAGLSAKD